MNPRNSEFKRNYLGNEEIRESNAHKTKIWITSMLPPGLREIPPSSPAVKCFVAVTAWANGISTHALLAFAEPPLAFLFRLIV